MKMGFAQLARWIRESNQKRCLFWERHSALLYGLALLLGWFFALSGPSGAIWTLVPFSFLLSKKRVFSLAFLFLFPCWISYRFYVFPPQGASVEGVFSIHSLKKSERFGEGWLYRGSLQTEEGRLFCCCFSKDYHPPSWAYQLQGRLRLNQTGSYILKPESHWETAQKRWSLVEIRYRSQQSLKQYIEKRISCVSPEAGLFLMGLVTGQIEEEMLIYNFGELGLTHLLAISGFHFGLLAFLLHLLLRLLLPHKIQTLCLMILMTFYFLFVGDSPSVMRAWVMSMLFLLGQLLEKQSLPLNTLGVALCVTLLYQPLSVMSLSFQLSFLATAGILAFYRPMQHLLQAWIPKETFSSLLSASAWHQHRYLILSFFRDALALNCAVHLTLLPLLLTAFHRFSVNSLIYNLFFPFLAGLALFLFLIGIPLGSWIHILAGHYTSWILQITDSPPVTFRNFYSNELPLWLVPCLLSLLLAVTTQLHSQNKSQ